MKRLSIATVRVLLLLTIGTLTTSLNADDKVEVAKPPGATKLKNTQVDWQKDPVCRMVFYAVLEGLYEDGVSNDVVDSIVPRQVGKSGNRLKTSFVFACPLCHPVYEAFRVYQQRPGFNANSDKNTFGPGLDAKTAKGLKSAGPRARIGTLAPLVQKWIKRRLEMMRLSAVETEQWNQKLAAHSETGRNFLSTHIRNDELYKGWSVYWGCAACNGTTRAVAELLREAKAHSKVPKK